MQGLKPPGRAPHPQRQRRPIECNFLSGKHLLQPIERHMIAVLHRRDMRKEGFAHHAAVDRLRRRRRLDNRALARSTAVTRTDDPLHAILNWCDIEYLLVGLADLVQDAAAAGAALVIDVDDHLDARQMDRQTPAIAIGARLRRRHSDAFLLLVIADAILGFVLVRRFNAGLFILR